MSVGTRIHMGFEYGCHHRQWRHVRVFFPSPTGNIRADRDGMDSRPPRYPNVDPLFYQSDTSFLSIKVNPRGVCKEENTPFSRRDGAEDMLGRKHVLQFRWEEDAAWDRRKGNGLQRGGQCEYIILRIELSQITLECTRFLAIRSATTRRI